MASIVVNTRHNHILLMRLTERDVRSRSGFLLLMLPAP
jgi:hypothetical protein